MDTRISYTFTRFPSNPSFIFADLPQFTQGMLGPVAVICVDALLLLDDFSSRDGHKAYLNCGDKVSMVVAWTRNGEVKIASKVDCSRCITELKSGCEGLERFDDFQKQNPRESMARLYTFSMIHVLRRKFVIHMPFLLSCSKRA